jgi:hypothetical protein
MKSQYIALGILMLTLTEARVMTLRPLGHGRLFKRQVPQEHSHDRNVTDPFRAKCFEKRGNLPDPIFGMLGDGA